MSETVFFHRESATLVLGDLIENHDPRIFSPTERFFSGLNGMLGPRAQTPRNFQWSFWCRDETRSAIERLIAMRPKRVLLPHGFCVYEDAVGFLRNGFRWLNLRESVPITAT